MREKDLESMAACLHMLRAAVSIIGDDYTEEDRDTALAGANEALSTLFRIHYNATHHETRN